MANPLSNLLAPTLVEGNPLSPGLGWWLYGSGLHTGAIRIADLARISIFLVARIVDIIGVVFQVIFRSVSLTIFFLASWFNFYFGLLLGEFRFDVTFFMPIITFLLAFLAWLFWPELAVFVEDFFWPFLLQAIQILLVAMRIFFVLFNIVVRVWNMIIPVIGVILYIIIEVFAVGVVTFIKIVGDAGVDVIFTAWLDNVTAGMTMFANSLEAFTSISPELTQQFADGCGQIVSSIVELGKLAVTVVYWVFRTLFTSFASILTTTISVVKWVRKHKLASFAKRSLFGVDEQQPEGIHQQSTMDDLDVDFWQAWGEVLLRYETEQSLSAQLNMLEYISAHNARYPVGTFSHYHQAFGIVDTGPPKRTTLSTDEKEEHQEEDDSILPPAWKRNGDTQTGNNSAARESLPQKDLSWMFISPSIHKHKTLDSHRLDASSEHSVLHDMNKKVECKSKFCGGHGTSIPHPLRYIKDNPNRRVLMDQRNKMSKEAHKDQFVHVSASLHAFRAAMKHSLDRHYYSGHFHRETQRWFKHHVGVESLNEAAERFMGDHEDPLDAIMSRTPILADMWPFNKIVERHPVHEQDAYLGNWMRNRVHVLKHERHDIERKGTRVWHVEVTPSEYEQITGERWHNRAAHVNDDYVLARRKHVVARHRERRGAVPAGVPHSSGGGGSIHGEVFPGPSTPQSFPTSSYEDQDVPTIPEFKFLLKLNCYDKPKSSMCLPEMPMQLVCFAEAIADLLPEEFPLDFKNAEDHCDRWFYRLKRPGDLERYLVFINIGRYLYLFIGGKVIANGLIWMVVSMGMIFPTIKLSFQILNALPWIGGIWDPIINAIPDWFTFRDDIPCLFLYFYCFLVVVFLSVLAYLYALPFAMWVSRFYTSLSAMWNTLRAIEAAKNQRVEDTMQWSYYHQGYDSEANPGKRLLNDRDYMRRNSLGMVPHYLPLEGRDPMSRPYYDRWRQLESLRFRRPGDRGDLHRPRDPRASPYESATQADLYTSLPDGSFALSGASNAQERLVGDERAPLLDASAPPHVSDYESAYPHIEEWIQHLAEGVRVFGVPSANEPVEYGELHEFERRWAWLINSLHITNAWLRRVVNVKLKQDNLKANYQPSMHPYVRTVTFNADKHVNPYARRAVVASDIP